MAVTQMIIVAFAVTVFLIGAILGLRFRVVVLIAPVIVGFVAIVAVGIASGNGAGFIFVRRVPGPHGIAIRLCCRGGHWLFRHKVTRARRLGRNHRDRIAFIQTSSGLKQRAPV
jgi:hypothetical protein